MGPPHPFQQLSLEEAAVVKEIILSQHDGELVLIREIAVAEPAKAEMLPFLELEHAGKLTAETPRPARLAFCRYDTISSREKLPIFQEATVDLSKRTRVKHEIIGKEHHAPLILDEFDHIIQSAKASPEFQAAIAEFELPEGFEVVIEPWPYGAPDDAENKRYFQGLIFAVDARSGNPDANFYAFPLPLIPVMDAQTRKIIRIDRLATGGKGAHPDSTERTHAKKVLEHCRAAEYVPELLPGGTRKDLKPLNVLQPEGPSFGVTDESLVEWQKWRFRVSFTPREGAVIHDVHYDGRSLFYRLSVSEMTVPYADARAPYHRKQAFDFGDSGAGPCCNNLGLGCDCLGVIKYFDGILVGDNGKIKAAPNVICLHEQDNGIGWKHTNWRTGRAVVTRNRELVVQFILTLANYEYVFAYKFNQSGGIDIETRATGIVSCVNIDPGQTSDYGNVVGPGVLAQNHQHIFAIRIDPHLDGQNNSVFTEESHAVPLNPETNPRGNFYSIQRTPFEKAAWSDADPMRNRVFKMVNESVTNPISGKPVGFKLVPPATQLLLADPSSIQALRAEFATHHFWVTEYRDDELYAGGRYTLQSRKDIGGVADAVARGDPVRNKDVVCWSVFGLTHNPRVEDWPVMPVEIHTVSLRPSDFFNANPSIDVPSNKNLTSQLVTNKQADCCNGANGTNGINGH